MKNDFSWDSHHLRHALIYPNEDLVRFLNREARTLLAKSRVHKALDVGVGSGRHTELLARYGFRTFGTDISRVALRLAAGRLRRLGLKAVLARSSMTSLPFEDRYFSIVVSYSVFQYGTGRDMEAAVREVHRVLKPGGLAFIVVRTPRDFRCGKGKRLGPGTFRLATRKTGEFGTVQHFPAENKLRRYFRPFGPITLERSETTFLARRALNSDWLVTAVRRGR